MSDESSLALLERESTRYKQWMLTHRCNLSTARKGIRYLRFLAAHRGLELGTLELTQDHATEFLARWREAGTKPRTLNSWIRELNLWLRFRGLDWKVAYFRHYETVDIRVPDEKLIKRLRALSWPDPSTSSRNRAIIAILSDVGPRRNEVVQLDLADRQRTESGAVLQIRFGKGEKSRALPIAPETARLLEEYVGAHRIRSHSSALFTTRSGRISYNYIARVIQRAGEQLGAPWLSPHKLRHFVVDFALDHGVSVGSVAELMGHARWETTQLYRQRRLAQRQMEREIRSQ